MDDGYLKVATRQSGASEKFWYAKQTTFMPACSATDQLHPATVGAAEGCEAILGS
jgi:hypothetical protein